MAQRLGIARNSRSRSRSGGRRGERRGERRREGGGAGGERRRDGGGERRRDGGGHSLANDLRFERDQERQAEKPKTAPGTKVVEDTSNDWWCECGQRNFAKRAQCFKCSADRAK